MTSWDEGYVSEIDYTYGYYLELNPQRMKLAFALAGFEAPEVTTAAELGFGQGMSVLIHSAVSDVEWHGNDFNPTQAGFAQRVSAETGIRVDLTDESFAEFCSRPDLPEFDFIGLHGIWSWINDANRAIIVDFLRRKLKVGGVVYMSYNTLPGWSNFVPIRHLMARYDERMGAVGRSRLKRIDEAVTFVESIFAADPTFLRQTPAVRDRFTEMMKHDRHYLAHEFFNRDWRPFHFSETAAMLSEAKLSYACSANLLDSVNALNLTDAQRDRIEAIDDPVLRETVRDLMVSQVFRKDYWVKGPTRLGDLDHGAAIRNVEVVMMTTPGAVSMKVTGAIGEAKLSKEIYEPLLAQLADYEPRTIGALAAALPELKFSSILQAIFVLTSSAALAVALPVTADTLEGARRINAAICKRSRSRSDLGFLASPRTGGGIPTTRFQQLFLLAWQEGHRTPEAWAKYAWDVLSSQNQRLIKDGKPIEKADGNLAELREMAETFGSGRLALLIAHGVAQA